MTTVGDSIFFYVFKTITWGKNVGKLLFLPSYYNDEIKLNTKTGLYTNLTFWIILHQKWFT